MNSWQLNGRCLQMSSSFTLSGPYVCFEAKLPMILKTNQKVNYDSFLESPSKHHHKLAILKQQTFLLSRFQRPEAQNQDIFRAHCLPEAPGDHHPCLHIFSWLQASLHLGLPYSSLFFCLHMAFTLVCPYASAPSVSYKDMGH